MEETKQPMEPRLKFAIAAFILAISFGEGAQVSGITSLSLAAICYAVAAAALSYIVWQFVLQWRTGNYGEQPRLRWLRNWPGLGVGQSRLP
jgi:hypothetical protein